MADTSFSEQAVLNREFDSATNAIRVESSNTGATADQVQGNTATAVADAGNPVKIGGLAKTTNPTAVTDGQRVNGVFDKVGRQVATLISVRELYAQANVQILNSTAETTLVAAGGAGVFNDLSCLFMTNVSATGTQVDIRDAAAGTIRLTVYVPANATVDVNPVTYLTQTTANATWTAQCAGATSDLRIFTQVIKNV